MHRRSSGSSSGADGAGRFDHGIGVISTKPISSRRACALRDRNITNQAGKHGGAKFSNGQTVTQRLNEIAGAQVGGDQVAASRGGAFDVIKLSSAHITGGVVVPTRVPTPITTSTRSSIHFIENPQKKAPWWGS